MLKRWKTASAPSHEELFIQHYGQLLAWAMQLTGRDRQQAEDLVHDVFIQFTLVQPPLDEIKNLEGYLFASMRNLLRSQMRREARRASNRLPLADYDSAEIGWQAADPRIDLGVRDELALICHYACVRKETSRAGSALILRFFLGYYPGEIALIFKSSRQAVADLLGASRREARLYLDQPQRLRFMRENPSSGIPEIRGGTESEDLIGELRRAIFRSCQGACLPKRELKDLYSSRSGSAAIDNQTLSHIVSCSNCLDLVNHELGLPTLADRYPTDTLGPDSGNGGGSAGGGESSGDSTSTSGSKMSANFAHESIKRFRRRLRDVIEHEPKELHIAVNGQVLGSQSVNAEMNQQNLHLDEVEKIGFIEVFSEQGIRLISLNVEPPPAGPFERQAQVALSERRTLHVLLEFGGPGASLEVVYHDPGFRPERDPIEVLAEEGSARSGAERKSEEPGRGSLFSGDWQRRLPALFWLRPGVVATALAMVLIAVLIILRLPGTPVSAAELLRRSAETEQAAAGNPGQILHRVIDLEEHDPAAGRLLARRRVEIWQSAERGLEVRRSYDDAGNLLAGELRRRDGTRTLMQIGESPLTDRGAQTSAPKNSEEAWRFDLSSARFAELIGRTGATTVEERPDAYVLRFLNPDGGSSLRAATLTLRRGALHPVEQVLVVQGDSGLREYRFAEARFEHHPASAGGSVFEIEPGLLPEPKAAKVEKTPAEEPRATERSVAAAPTPLPTPVALANAGLEIEALVLLDGIGATLGEEVSVTRTLDGALQIEGVVENDERKRAVLSALAPVRHHRAVRIRIETPEEAEQRLEQIRSTAVAVSIQEAAPADSRIPADADLRRYLTARGVRPAALDEEVNRFANRMLRGSRQAVLNAWSLRRLVQRFTQAELRALDPEARARWQALVGEHARRYGREMTALRQDLSVVFAAEMANAEAYPEIADEAALARGVLGLADLSAGLDEEIRSAFTLSAGGASSLRSQQFWRRWVSAEKLADEIFRAAQRFQNPGLRQ